MTPAPVFLHHPSSLEHDTGAHPERSERILAIEAELDGLGWLGFERELSPAVKRDTLTAVHPERYVEWIERAAARGGGALDMDTLMSAGSYQAALHAAGGAVRLVDMLLDGSAPTGFSSHRPPGHHAEPAQAMGFCLFNNIAVAARHAVSARGLERVMILDWDVHHGNGTNDIFRPSPEVLFVSIHQRALYPGTGAVTDAGTGEGTGYTVNLPVAAGSGDAVYASLVEHVAVPLARAYDPRLILISAGYDAHRDDPLAGCMVTEAGFVAMAASMCRVAAELGVPVGGVLEGGYDLTALARSVAATLEVLGAPAPPAPAPSDGLEIAPEAQEARRRLAERWPVLAA
ncbi:MAG TPA: histone deacetylase [Solirubrobacteraceae bacterium]|nr:histone deacetylase [Solirubrobacteraceae bacterium]